MAKIAIVKRDDLSIASWYDADAPNQRSYGGPWGDSTSHAHIELDAALDNRKVVAQNVADHWIKEGETPVSEDPQDITWTLVPAHIALVEDATKAAAVDAQDAETALLEQIAAVQAKCDKIMGDIKKRNAVGQISVADSRVLFAEPLVNEALNAFREGAIETARAVLVELASDSEAMGRLGTISSPDYDADYINSVVAEIDEFLS